MKSKEQSQNKCKHEIELFPKKYCCRGSYFTIVWRCSSNSNITTLTPSWSPLVLDNPLASSITNKKNSMINLTRWRTSENSRAIVFPTNRRNWNGNRPCLEEIDKLRIWQGVKHLANITWSNSISIADTRVSLIWRIRILLLSWYRFHLLNSILQIATITGAVFCALKHILLWQVDILGSILTRNY